MAWFLASATIEASSDRARTRCVNDFAPADPRPRSGGGLSGLAFASALVAKAGALTAFAGASALDVQSSSEIP